MTHYNQLATAHAKDEPITNQEIDEMTKAFGCVGSTIRLCSGAYIDLAAPDPKLIDIRDISQALSNICRFGGQIDQFYSVAQHSVACAQRAKQEGLPVPVQLACLMHDAAEAYIGDVVKPLKIILDPLYGPIEYGIEAAIAHAFNIDFESTADDWKRIDRMMLIAERRALFSADSVTWTGENEVERIEYAPDCWIPSFAKMSFEHCFYALQDSQI